MTGRSAPITLQRHSRPPSPRPRFTRASSSGRLTRRRAGSRKCARWLAPSTTSFMICEGKKHSRIAFIRTVTSPRRNWRDRYGLQAQAGLFIQAFVTPAGNASAPSGRMSSGCRCRGGISDIILTVKGLISFGTRGAGMCGGWFS